MLVTRWVRTEYAFRYLDGQRKAFRRWVEAKGQPGARRIEVEADDLRPYRLRPVPIEKVPAEAIAEEEATLRRIKASARAQRTRRA